MSITPLPDFLKQGYADAGLPSPKPRPGTMRFPEQRPHQSQAATAAQQPPHGPRATGNG